MLVRDRVEVWIRHQFAPKDLDALVFETHPNLFWPIQTGLQCDEYTGNIDSNVKGLIKQLCEMAWSINGQSESLDHGDLIIIPGKSAWLTYAKWYQTEDLGRMAQFSRDLGDYWACLDLGCFLGPYHGNPINADVSGFVSAKPVFLEPECYFPGF